MDGFPSCAKPCLNETGAASSCAQSDIQCLCGNPQLTTVLEGCFLQACTVKEAFTAKRLTDDTCGVAPRAQTDIFVVVSTLFLVIALICVLLRAAGRLVGSGFGLDDGAIGLALVIAIAVGVFAFPLRNLGLGEDIWNIPFKDITKTLHLFNISTDIYPPCIALIKISMLFLYLRLFPGRKLRIITIFTIVLTGCWGIIYTLLGIFACSPRSYAWTNWDGEHEGKCLNQAAIIVSHAIINIIFDVLVIALPLPTLLRLKLSKTKKAGVCLMFLVGFVVTVLSILRLSTSMGFVKSHNPTRDFVPVSIWSVLEIDIGIICACLPEIRALCKFVLPSSKSYLTHPSPQPSPENPPWRDTTWRDSRRDTVSGNTQKSFRLSLSSSGRVRPSAREFVTLRDV
ncbi:hypothetical protein BDW62DRAFT_201867 [Aspergillus aurantiobrunneus]